MPSVCKFCFLSNVISMSEKILIAQVGIVILVEV